MQRSELLDNVHDLIVSEMDEVFWQMQALVRACNGEPGVFPFLSVWYIEQGGSPRVMVHPLDEVLQADPGADREAGFAALGGSYDGRKTIPYLSAFVSEVWMRFDSAGPTGRICDMDDKRECVICAVRGLTGDRRFAIFDLERDETGMVLLDKPPRLPDAFGEADLLGHFFTGFATINRTRLKPDAEH